MQSLLQVQQALLTVTNNVFHYTALKAIPPYIVWAEDSGGQQIQADNIMSGQVIQGTIDYFTLTENDANVEEIQAALTAAEISFFLNSVQFEEETGYIHFEWVFEVV